MDPQGYILTEAPILHPGWSCEGTTTLFEVQYIDDQKAYLTQSGQLYVEATAMALGKGLYVCPTSAPRNRKRAATSPNSGCLSRRLPTAPWKT